MTGASVLSCNVWVTRRLLPPAEMADSFSTLASFRLKPQPAVKPLTRVRHRAAVLLRSFAVGLAFHMLRSTLDRTKLGSSKVGKREARRSATLKIRKAVSYGNSTLG